MSMSDRSEPTETGETRPLWTTASPTEAIQLALSQSKLFLVWICAPSGDSSPSPSPWEQVWADTAVFSFLSRYAVSIKLEPGSMDAAMFLQLVQSAPSATGVWIVFAGRMLDSFDEAPSPQEMLQRIQSALSVSQAQIISPPESIPTAQAEPMASTSSTASRPSEQSHSIMNEPSPQSDSVREQLAARRARLEAAKAQHEKEEREARRAAGTRQLASADPERQKYVAQQARERAQQRTDRAKILQEIENDKEERRQARARQQQQQQNTTTQTQPQSQSPDPKVCAEGSGMTILSIRFPDSSVLRADFEAEQTLADVRVWIDERRPDILSPPYVLQTTFPTRTFEVSEERNESLHSIFGKGGQVILKEIKTYSGAYQPNPSGIMSFASSLVGSVTGTISNALGWNTPPTPPLASTADSGARTPGEAVREARIRNVNYSARERGVASTGSSDVDDREKNWFNGNGLAQEAPRRDDLKRD